MWLAGTIAVFIAAVALNACVCRVAPTLNRVTSFLSVGSLMGIGLGLSLLKIYGMTAQTFAGISLFALACELYIFLFTLTISSISANLLTNLFARNMTDSD